MLWIHWDEPAGISFPFLSSWMVPLVLLSLFCFFFFVFFYPFQVFFFFFSLSTFWPQAGDVRKDLSRETKPRGQMWDFSNTGCEIGLLERLPQRRRKNDKNHKIKNVPPGSVQPVTWKFSWYNFCWLRALIWNHTNSWSKCLCCSHLIWIRDRNEQSMFQNHVKAL